MIEAPISGGSSVLQKLSHAWLLLFSMKGRGVWAVEPQGRLREGQNQCSSQGPQVVEIRLPWRSRRYQRPPARLRQPSAGSLIPPPDCPEPPRALPLQARIADLVPPYFLSPKSLPSARAAGAFSEKPLQSMPRQAAKRVRCVEVAGTGMKPGLQSREHGVRRAGHSQEASQMGVLPSHREGSLRDSEMSVPPSQRVKKTPVLSKREKEDWSSGKDGANKRQCTSGPSGQHQAAARVVVDTMSNSRGTESSGEGTAFWRGDASHVLKR